MSPNRSPPRCTARRRPIADDAAAHSGAGIEAPQHLAGVGVERLQLAHRVAVEDQAAARRQNTGEAGHVHVNRPFPLARERIVGAELSGLAAVRRHDPPSEIVRAGVAGAVVLGIDFLLDRLEVVAEVEHVVVPKAGFRIVGTRIPALRTERGWADQRLLVHRQLDAFDQAKENHPTSDLAAEIEQNCRGRFRTEMLTALGVTFRTTGRAPAISKSAEQKSRS